GTFEGRFTLQFEYEVLSNNDVLASNISLYPNPTNDVVTVAAKTPVTQVVIHDLQGRLVHTQAGTGSNELSVSTQQLRAAMYFVTITTQEGTVTKRLIKR
ncbi:T9SS type A sorting domain-containing protein, partial [Altibacter sp. HG106]|uniref:T9SS type A sorting domain-containing protein n=1 Tax=Altibacter sp. HG106 TaxID=3023937 RepID=UPI00235015F7